MLCPRFKRLNLDFHVEGHNLNGDSYGPTPCAPLFQPLSFSRSAAAALLQLQLLSFSCSCSPAAAPFRLPSSSRYPAAALLQLRLCGCHPSATLLQLLSFSCAFSATVPPAALQHFNQKMMLQTTSHAPCSLCPTRCPNPCTLLHPTCIYSIHQLD